MAGRFHAIAVHVLAVGLSLDVFVRDDVGLAPGELAEATLVTARIFERAGIEVVWLDANGIRGRTGFYTVRVEAEGTNALGSAAVGTRVARIFYGRVVQATRAAGADVPVMLGHAVAHELGHLLLGRTAHSVSGIMHAQMDVPRAAQGRLLFTDDEARTMRARLGP